MKRLLFFVSACLAAGLCFAAAQVTPPAAPTKGASILGTLNQSTSEWSAQFTWTDNSSNESGFLVLEQTGVGNYSILGTVAANSTSVTINGLQVGTTYAFAVAAYRNDASQPNGFVASEVLDFPVLRAPDYFLKKWFGGTAGAVLAGAALEVSRVGAVTGASATNMPAWMSFDDSTGTFHGTPPAAGVYTASVSLTYDDGWVLNGTATVRVVPAASGPVESAPLPAPVLAAGGATSAVNLDNHFIDPDTTQAVRLTTTKGAFDIILQPQAAPQTVANFLAYVNGVGAAGYDDAVIHRSVPSFVIQGGGYKPAGGLGFTAVTDLAPVQNEPGLANLRGTLSMAKLGGNPNSATNEWFVNLGNNTANLDYQNEGFSVFARVAGTGMDTVDAIAALPRGNYTDPTSGVTIGGSSAGTVFGECPMDAATAPAAMDQGKLVKILTARTVAPLAYQVVSNSNPAVVSASISGNSLQLNPATNAAGTAQVVVRATDLDGNTKQSTLQVTVQWNFAAWASANGLSAGSNGPGDDPDRDGMENRLEYGLLAAPTSSSGAGVMPGKTSVGGANYATVTFPVRKYSADLVYRVQRSVTLGTGSWTEIWNSNQGFGHAQVVATVDQADRTMVTVRDTVANPTEAFLRVVVE